MQNSHAHLLLLTAGGNGRCCSCSKDVLYPGAAAAEQAPKNNPSCHVSPPTLVSMLEAWALIGKTCHIEQGEFLTCWKEKSFFFISSLLSRIHLRSKILPFLSTFFFARKTVHVFVGKEDRELKYQNSAGTNKSSSRTTASREVLTSKLTWEHRAGRSKLTQAEPIRELLYVAAPKILN